MYNELIEWLKSNYKDNQFYLTVDEIKVLIKKIASFQNEYPDMDEVTLFEQIKPLLSIKEVKTLECHYRTDAVIPSYQNLNNNENRAEFWTTYIPLTVKVNNHDIIFSVVPDGMVRKSDLIDYFKIKNSDEDLCLVLDSLYLLLKTNIKRNKYCDYSDIENCIKLHHKDIELKKKIWDAAKEKANYNEIKEYPNVKKSSVNR
jgi:hypothetical protein